MNKSKIDKITTLWAFSEAALGGILHAFKIPFTGLFIGGSAVIFISLIAYYADSRKVIFESTLKVILVKFVVSPYSPIAAYFAVFLQSILGYILFFGGFKKTSAILLGFLSLLFSSFQKIIILTLIFGMTLWESIDIFFDFVLNKLLPESQNIEMYNVTYMVVGSYIVSHVLGGLFAGWYASILPEKIAKHSDDKKLIIQNSIGDFLNSAKKKKKRKKWWKKPSTIFIFLISVGVIFISFQFEEVDQSIASKIIAMLLRSVLIIIVWYYFISPVLFKIVNNFLVKKKKKQAKEIENIVELFPNIKAVIKYSWSEVQLIKGLKKYLVFLDNILINFILFEESENE